MFDDKERPQVLIYALVFFGLLTVIVYRLLLATPASVGNETSSPNVEVPSYQSLFSPE